MEFTKLLEERRSIRAFDPEKHVTAEQIQEIVQAAIQAPSWKNSQTTRYYALVTPEKVEEFSAKCLPEFNQKSSKGAALVVTAFVKDRSGFTQDGTPDSWKRLGLLRSRPARRKPDPARKRTWP